MSQTIMTGFVSSLIRTGDLRISAKRRAVTSPRRRFVVRAQDEPNDKKEEHDIPDGGRDWNAEWQKFKDSGMKPTPTPLDETIPKRAPSTRYQRTKNLRKKEMEKKSRPTNMRQQVTNTQVGPFSLPPWRVLQKDWRFWLAVIVAISVTSSLLTSLGSQTNQVTGGYL